MDQSYTTATIIVRDDNYRELVQSASLSEKLEKEAKIADVLLFPNRGHAGRDAVYFPSGTSELYAFLQSTLPTEVRLEAAIDEKDYRELALHGFVVIVATIVCANVIAPLVVRAIDGFLKKREGLERSSNSTVKSRLVVYKDKESRLTEFYYEGPAASFADVMTKQMGTLSSEPTACLESENGHEQDKNSIEDRRPLGRLPGGNSPNP